MLMEFRCQHCGHRIVLNAPPAANEVVCPSCGTMMKLPQPPPSAPPVHHPPHQHEHSRRSSKRTLRRIFDPIPRPFMYLVGGVFVLVILTPFWIYLLKERYDRRRPVFSDDAGSIPIPSATDTNPAPADIEQPRSESGSTIDEFHGIRLNATLEGLQHRYNLRLQNTRGMVPEIYEATRVGDVENALMHFYSNSLKEFWVDMHERRVVPDHIEQELQAQFGDPKERAVRSGGQADTGLGLKLPGATGVTQPSTGREKKLAGFPYHVDITWADDETRTEATIYYTSSEPRICSSLLTIHISATHWLDSNRPGIGSVAAPTTNQLDNTNAVPTPPEPPKRLFP